MAGVSQVESVWRGKFRNLKEYYADKFGGYYEHPKTKKKHPYYTLTELELQIDPDEKMKDIENYDKARQTEEIIKCANSFEYFCHKYVKILHPTDGLIPFVLYNYQRKVIREYVKHRFNIIAKFRQGGLTTVTLLWGLWRTMFDTDQQISFMSKTDREAINIAPMIDRAIKEFPDWLKPHQNGKWNDHLKEFEQTGGTIKFNSPEAARGMSATFLIIDEAAFIIDMESHWKAMYPTLSAGGSCAVISTVNGMGNWYHKYFTDAKEKHNKFNCIELDFWEHPDYNNAEWLDDQRKQLGEKGFNQEILREFLGSGETYFSTKIITRTHEQTYQNHPVRKTFSQWVHQTGKYALLEEEHRKGALWIWKEAEIGQEYILSVDAAEGQGENNDSSVFEVLNSATLEQVAEFYSNTIPTHIFAQIVNSVGQMYNMALVIVESQGPGISVLEYLHNTLNYENLYREPGKTKPGLKIGAHNRTLCLQALQNRLIENSVRINSIRLATEMHTFQYNPQKRRPEAQKGQHDDAIMAMAIALHIRDALMQDLPVGVEIPRELNSLIIDCDDVMQQLMEGKPEDYLAEENDYLSFEHSMKSSFNFTRKSSRVLDEFGW